MKSTPSPKEFEDIASELATEPAFVEKEWHGIQLLAHLAAFEDLGNGEIVFTGGTCLSTAHGIIERFSEDLDFILRSKEEIPRAGRRRIRESMLDHIVSDERFALVEGSLKKGNNSRFFEAHYEYPKAFDHDSLRPHIKLEASFRNNKLATSRQNIRSVFAKLKSADPETGMECISPVETAADKISALTWRLIARNRAAPDDDPDTVRHLHDLAALKDGICANEKDFVDTVHKSLAQDEEERLKEKGSGMTVAEKLGTATEMLSKDETYREEYNRFVGRMSYARADDRVNFDEARGILGMLVDKITSAND